MLKDAEYFARRAGEEREAAFDAETVSVRLRHLEFAEAYELRVREILAMSRRSQTGIIERVPTASVA